MQKSHEIARANKLSIYWSSWKDKPASACRHPHRSNLRTSHPHVCAQLQRNEGEHSTCTTRARTSVTSYREGVRTLWLAEPLTSFHAIHPRSASRDYLTHSGRSRGTAYGAEQTTCTVIIVYEALIKRWYLPQQPDSAEWRCLRSIWLQQVFLRMIALTDWLTAFFGERCVAHIRIWSDVWNQIQKKMKNMVIRCTQIDMLLYTHTNTHTVFVFCYGSTVSPSSGHEGKPLVRYLSDFFERPSIISFIPYSFVIASWLRTVTRSCLFALEPIFSSEMTYGCRQNYLTVIRHPPELFSS
jgi:hypothetical protein